jgi:NADH:ubiquinone oxidoreductase subunit 5 (subunit L)/multisubunit Na+/H+ antiporter MnhA subunit
MLVNKIGDCALLAALVFSHLQFSTTSFSILFDSIFLSPRGSELIIGDLTSVSVLVLLLFIAVMAKSAQFGLHS